ncbi:Ribosomal RNA processing protein 1-like protein, partial [Stegodyphus mimosarum]
MAREWGTIDRYRLEKFMMLVRKFLHQCYQLLRSLKWDPEHIRGFCKVMKKTVINPSHEGAPLGLKMHICDIYMEELTIVGHEELTPDLVKMFLIPYCRMLWKCDDYFYLSDVAKNIFLYLINQDADERKFHEFPVLKFDAESVQQLLLKFAKKPSLRKKNMKVIYNIVKQFEDFKNGVCSADKIFEDQSSGPKLRKRD